MNQYVLGKLEKSSRSKAVGVIMAGGFGTRFWPQSRRSRPKQFLSLGDGSESLIQATARRISPLSEIKNQLVVTSQLHLPLAEAQLPGVPLLLEPVPRNTAPCVGFAAKRILHEVGDLPMVCVPADHFIRGDAGLVDVLNRAVELASRSEVLVTVGIPPTSPETGYGYIRRGAPQASVRGAYSVEKFVEKPNKEKALEYLQSGDYYWNAGIFVWRPSVILAAIAEFLPKLSVRLDRIGDSFGHPQESLSIESEFSAMEAVSVDVGVMERASNAVVFAGDSFQWSDIGSWSAWADCISQKHEGQQGEIDGSGNLIRGGGVLVGCEQTVVLGDPDSEKRFVACVGLDKLIIVDTKDALLVVARDRAQDVKKVVEYLEQIGRTDLLR